MNCSACCCESAAVVVYYDHDQKIIYHVCVSSAGLVNLMRGVRSGPENDPFLCDLIHKKFLPYLCYKFKNVAIEDKITSRNRHHDSSYLYTRCPIAVTQVAGVGSGVTTYYPWHVQVMLGLPMHPKSDGSEEVGTTNSTSINHIAGGGLLTSVRSSLLCSYRCLDERDQEDLESVHAAVIHASTITDTASFSWSWEIAGSTTREEEGRSIYDYPSLEFTPLTKTLSALDLYRIEILTAIDGIFSLSRVKGG
ncbi:hypothetical protein Ancab_020755 [Ancistrocladus abbreviatus]